MKYTAVLAFDPALEHVLLVQKLKPKTLAGLWNGIGGKLELGESPIGCAIREFHEEAGLAVHKDDMVYVEHQTYLNGAHEGAEVYWYATIVPALARRIRGRLLNDVGESLSLWRVREVLAAALMEEPGMLAPNTGWLTLKARTYLQTPYLERPW